MRPRIKRSHLQQQLWMSEALGPEKTRAERGAALPQHASFQYVSTLQSFFCFFFVCASQCCDAVATPVMTIHWFRCLQPKPPFDLQQEFFYSKALQVDSFAQNIINNWLAVNGSASYKEKKNKQKKLQDWQTMTRQLDVCFVFCTKPHALKYFHCS